MRRFLGVWAAILMIAVLASHNDAVAATARARSVIDRDVVVLGDLFDGLPPDVAARAIYKAPRPGQKTPIDSALLQTTAAEHGISFTASRMDRVIIERAGVPLPKEALLDALARALVQRGAAAGVTPALDSDRKEIFIAPGAPAIAAVADLDYDVVAGRFSALVMAPAGDPDAERIRITGRALTQTFLPVLTRPIGAGEVIKAHDVEMKPMRADQATRITILAPQHLIGRAAKRPLPAGQPIKIGEITAALLVAKNSVIDVRVLSGALIVNMQGRALEDGVEGETIRVLNTRSNKTIHGVVTGPNQVTIAAGNAR